MKNRWMRSSVWMGLSFLLCLDCGVFRLGADALSNWHWRNPVPTGESIADIAFGNGTFALVDSAGGILKSVDGKEWSVDLPPVNSPLNSIAFGNGRFVAVGQRGRIVSSYSGNWIECQSGTQNTLTAVTYGGGVYVAVGLGGTILRSTDGLSWAVQPAGTGKDLTAVSYGAGAFVAAGGDRAALVSRDGSSWDSHLIGEPPFQIGPFSAGLVWAFDRFYATIASFRFDAQWVTYSSTNGINWIRETNLGGDTLLDAASNGDQTVFARVDGGIETDSVTLSTNGLNWTYSVVSTGAVIRTVSFGNGLFVAGGANGALARSTNGVTWEVVRGGDSNLELVSAVEGGGTYVFVGSTILSSSNLVDFSRKDGLSTGLPIPLAFLGAAYGNGVFVVGGTGGRIVRSTNGVDWAVAATVASTKFRGFAYGGGKFVAVGERGSIRISSDGKVWQGIFSGVDQSLLSITYGGGLFVIVGTGGMVLTSPDGSNWQMRSSEVESILMSVIHAQGNFLAVGYDEMEGQYRAAIIKSPDGVNWTAIESGLAVPFSRIAYGGGMFVATTGTGGGSAGSVGVYLSADGQNWSKHIHGSSTRVGGVSFIDNSFFLMGKGGTILQSDKMGGIYIEATLPFLSSGVELKVTGGEMGQAYHIQECTNLVSEIWLDRVSILQTQYVSKVLMPEALGSQRFYRMRKAINP